MIDSKRMSKLELAKRARRIVYLRDVQHLKNGGDQLRWKEIAERFCMTGTKAAKIYKETKERMEAMNV